MKVKFYSLKEYEIDYLNHANEGKHEFSYTSLPLSADTISECRNYEAISVFTNDDLSHAILDKLREFGIKHIAIRATGYDHIDLNYASTLNISVANVPSYSPYSVAEQVITLILALNRKIVISQTQVKQYNFTLNNLIGFDLHGKTVGIIGTGRIGSIVAKIIHGFGCKILAYDQSPNLSLVNAFDVNYCTKEEVLSNSDILTLHIPLNENTRYFIDKENIKKMKNGVMLINTGRGGIINTEAVIDGLKTGKIGYLGIDVYEKEKGVFFQDHSGEILTDDTLLKLMSFKNVLITPHQGFLTKTALEDIAETTLYNINSWANGEKSSFEITQKMISII